MEENIIECKNLTHYYGKRLIYEKGTSWDYWGKMDVAKRPRLIY